MSEESTSETPKPPPVLIGNPAKRLAHYMSRAMAFGNDGSAENAWAQVFGLTLPGDWLGLLRRGRALMELVPQVEHEIRSVVTDPENANTMLELFPSVGTCLNHFRNLSNHQMHIMMAHFSPQMLTAIQGAGVVLDQSGRKYTTLSTAAYEQVRAAVDDLAALLEDEYVAPETRAWLREIIEELREALGMVAVMGDGPLQAANDRLAGGARTRFYRERQSEAAHSPSRVWTVVDAVWTQIDRALETAKKVIAVGVGLGIFVAVGEVAAGTKSTELPSAPPPAAIEHNTTVNQFGDGPITFEVDDDDHEQPDAGEAPTRN